MLCVLFAFCLLRFGYTGVGQPFYLTAGTYTVHCYGAQGGHSYEQGYYEYGTKGGLGAHVYGTMKVVGKILFYAYVGGEGQCGRVGPNAGGFNGGGLSGRDKEDHEDGPGGGGGSTDIRINRDTIQSRIIVAAGGSGAVGVSGGANGGDLYGRYVDPNRQQQLSFSTTQISGYALLNGGPGESGKYHPGSGGGGGYYGGVGGAHMRMEYQTHAIGHSGSSYISGQCGCSVHPEMTFTNGSMIVGEGFEGHGHIEIYTDILCSENCLTCENNGECDICMDGYFFFNKKCFNSCPNGTHASQDGKECIYNPTKEFTNSNEFSMSMKFSNSNEFSKSNEFTYTKEFTYSIEFTKSNEFSSTESLTHKIDLITFNWKNKKYLGLGTIYGILFGCIAFFVIITIANYILTEKINIRVENYSQN